MQKFKDFDQLKKDFEKNGTKNFHRSTEENQKYKAKCQSILKDYCSLEDYILVKILKFGTYRTKEGDKIKYKAFRHNWVKKTRLIYSDFSYQLPPDAEHLIFWSIFLNEEHDITAITNKLDGREYFYFRNAKENQSVQGIRHYHIIVKKIDNLN